MATNISCPNCHEGHGKDKENYKHMSCCNCGHEWFNQYGCNPEDEKDEEEED